MPDVPTHEDMNELAVAWNKATSDLAGEVKGLQEELAKAEDDLVVHKAVREAIQGYRIALINFRSHFQTGDES